MFTGYPDLNYTTALNNPPLFKAIVFDGALRENGMMPFNKSLSTQDVEAIRSYLTFRANDLKKNPPRRLWTSGRRTATATATARAAPVIAPTSPADRAASGSAPPAAACPCPSPSATACDRRS